MYNIYISVIYNLYYFVCLQGVYLAVANVRLRLKIIGHLETMHDPDLPTLLIISLPIIFKCTVINNTVRQCWQRRTRPALGQQLAIDLARVLVVSFRTLHLVLLPEHTNIYYQHTAHKRARVLHDVEVNLSHAW